MDETTNQEKKNEKLDKEVDELVAHKTEEANAEKISERIDEIKAGVLEQDNRAKTLHNSDASGAKTNVPDIKFFGDGDMFQLLSKASSQREGWMKSCKAMQIDNIGCVVQVTTQQRNPDGSYAVAEALTFVPGVCIEENIKKDEAMGRRLSGLKQSTGWISKD